MRSSVLFRAYVVGYLLSIILTLTSFMIVGDKLLNGWGLTMVLTGFAVVQLVVQLVFFLHLDREQKPRWNLTVMLFAVLVLIIVVAGSLWIMKNLNYHGMSPQETEDYLLEEEAIQR